MPKALRTIQVGIGGMGGGHLRTLLENPHFNLVAVCDAYPRRADVSAGRKRTAEAGIPFFTDYREAFDQIEADLAFICTPHHWHAPMTIAALEGGMHVFVEKPATSSAADADRMVAAQRKARKVVVVGFNPTTSRDCVALKDHIARGDLGEIREVVAIVNWYRADDYYRRAQWVGRAKVDGKWCRDGVMFNQASHSVAAALLLANTSPRPRMSVGRKARAALYRAHAVRTLEMEDLACAVVELDGPSKTRLCFYATTCNQRQNGSSWIRVFGDKGAATLGARHIDMYDGTKRPLRFPAKLASKHDNLYEAITRGAMPYSPLAEGVKATYTIDAIYRAARNQIRKVKWDGLGELSENIARAAAERCLFSEMDSPPPWA
jgi:predicted dehydrogenase